MFYVKDIFCINQFVNNYRIFIYFFYDFDFENTDIDVLCCLITLINGKM